MNWQSSARRNGRTLANGKCLSAIRLNTFSTPCPRRLHTLLDKWQRTKSLIYSPSIRRASVLSAGIQKPWPGPGPLAYCVTETSGREKSYDRPVDLALSAELLSTMSAAADTVLRQPTLPPEPRANDGQKEIHPHKRPSPSPGHRSRRNKSLKRRHEENKTNPRMQKIRDIKQSLPMNQYRAEVLKLVNENVYSIIVGATGSGKSTQVPQIILEDAIERGEGSTINIICTQPRRIAATSIAHRVAAERNEALGDSVGYFMRFENKSTKPTGSIQYCTIGAMLRKMHKNPHYLDNLSHIVLDEVHERSIEIDMAMVVLKKLVETRLEAGQHVPHIVIMSATLDEPLFRNYFAQTDSSGTKIPCPIVTVPGRTFPVKRFYLDSILSQIKRSFTEEQLIPLVSDKACGQYVLRENRFNAETINNFTQSRSDSRKNSDSVDDSPFPLNLVSSTIAHVVKSSKSSGAVLVFLPGWKEIVGVKAALEAGVLGVDFSNTSEFKLYSVHSEHLDSQTELFSPEAEGVRKVILATNIAETSITIPEVEYVVDFGKHRQDSYNQEEGTSELNTTWISKSSSDQRAGRAGRVQNGKYYALFSEKRYKTLGKAIPNILRADIQAICLDAKARSPELSIKEFLAGAIEPPHPDTIDTAIESLRDIDALNHEEEITPLGTLLSSLPLHPYVGRMIVLGIVFRCLDPMLMLSASTSTQRLFVRPLGSEREANVAHRSFDNNYNSDPVRFVTAFCAARDCQARSRLEYEKFMKESYMSSKSFENIQKVMIQIQRILENEGLIPRRMGPRDLDVNENSGNFALIRALSIAAHRGNIARREGTSFFQTHTGDRALMGRSSANSLSKSSSNKAAALEVPETAIVSYEEMGRADDGQYTLRNTTLISPVAAALFASEIEIGRGGSSLTINKWLPLRIKGGPGLPAREDISTVILLFREAWDQILSSAFARLSNRRYPINYAQQQAFVDALVSIVSRDFGDEDVRRVMEGIEQDKKKAAREQEKSQARAARDEVEAVRIGRLKGHLSHAYSS